MVIIVEFREKNEGPLAGTLFSAIFQLITGVKKLIS